MKRIIQVLLEALIALSTVAVIIFAYFVFTREELITNAGLLVTSIVALITSAAIRANLYKSGYHGIIILLLSGIYLYSATTLSLETLQDFCIISAIMLFFTFDALIRNRKNMLMRTVNVATTLLVLVVLLYDPNSYFMILLSILFLITNAALIAISQLKPTT